MLNKLSQMRGLLARLDAMECQCRCSGRIVAKWALGCFVVLLLFDLMCGVPVLIQGTCASLGSKGPIPLTSVAVRCLIRV
jgi:hypothetical protein